MAKFNEFIGFPEGMLGAKPFRLPVLANERDWFVLMKPGGLLGQTHPRYPGLGDISGCIKAQVFQGKGELKRLEISACHYIFGPEMEISGPILFAKHKHAADYLKNALGSDQMIFKYYLLSESISSGSRFCCNLPVAQHKERHMALVSHKTGKKASTSFSRVSEGDRVSLWEAVTRLPRPDQIRLHAAEMGIPVMGDTLYGGVSGESADAIIGSSGRIPRFPGLALFLHEVDLNFPTVPEMKIKAPPSKQFSVFCLKRGIMQVE